MSLEAVVEYEYTAEQPDELSLKVGDIINNVQTVEGGWWEGELNGKKGMFPENFVKIVKMRQPAPAKVDEKREAPQRKSVRELANKFKDNMPSVGGPPKKKEKQKKCKALFEYKKENDDELDLAVGDIIDFHRQVEDGWWEGSLNGKQGVFPSNFVEMLEETATPDDGKPPGNEEKEKPTVNTQNKDADFHTIKGKKVVGVGLGNIFGAGPIKLRAVADGTKEESPKPVRKEDSEPAPEATVREKQNTPELAVVRFSYTAEQPDELSLVEGEIIRILDKKLEDEGWWKGEVNGKVGVFPDNFVELIPSEDANKPRKPPPPSVSNMKSAAPKLPEKTPSGDTPDDKNKTVSEPQSPFSGKKPQVPPPVVKKPLNQKLAETKPEPAFPHQQNSIKDRPSAKENHAENHVAEGSAHFNGIEPGSQKLTHLTYNRAQGPKKRPPSSVLILNEGEKEESSEEVKNSRVPALEKQASHVPDRPDKPLPVLPAKDYRHPSQPSSHTEHVVATPQPSSLTSTLRDRELHSTITSTPRDRELHSTVTSTPRDRDLHTTTVSSALRDRDLHNTISTTVRDRDLHSTTVSSTLRDKDLPSGTPPPRPPEPSKAPALNATPALGAQSNKLIENLQQQLNELKANSVSKAVFKELQGQHEKLKLEFETLKKSHSMKIRDLMNEVDEEKKLRITTQVEIERVKKLISESQI